MKQILRLGLVLFSFLEWACQDLPEQKQPGAAESAGSVSTQEQINLSKTARVPSETEADSLLALEEQIMLQPDDAALRRALGRRAIDANAGVIWTVGKGRVNPHASHPSIAVSQAEQAAVIDASRWAAYLIEWHKMDYTTSFGTIQARVPGTTVVRKSTNDSLCVVLVRAPLKQE